MSCFEANFQELILEEISIILSDPSVELEKKDISRIISFSAFFSKLYNSENLVFDDIKDFAITESDIQIITGVGKIIRHFPVENQKKVVDILLFVLDNSLHLNYDFFQGWDTIPPNDKFISELVENLLLIGKDSFELNILISAKVWDKFMKVGSELKDQTPDLAITNYTPVWVGILRALSNTSYEWSSQQITQLEERIRIVSQTDTVDNIDEKVDQLMVSEGNAYAKSFFHKYLNGQLSSNHVIVQHMKVALNFLLRKLTFKSNDSSKPAPGTQACWDSLCSELSPSSFILDNESRASLHGLCYLSLEIFASLETHIIENSEQSSNFLEASQRKLAILCLKTAVLCSLHLQEFKENISLKINDILMVIYPKLKNDDGVEFAKIALDAISILSIGIPESHGSLSNLCCKFLISPTSDVESLASDTFIYGIREAASTRLASSVKYNRETATSMVHFLINNLFSMSEQVATDGIDKSNIIVFENIVSAIASIGQLSEDDQVSDLAVTMLCRQFAKSDHSIRAYILERLAEIVLHVPQSSYDEILELFSAVSNAETTSGTKPLMSTILKCYYTIAYQIHSKVVRCDSFFKYMLVLANEKGVHIQRSLKEKRKGVQITAIAGELGILLPVLGQILRVQNFNPHLDPNEELQGECRNLWFHCVLYDFVSESTWVKEWRSSMLDIAAKTPMLVPNSSGTYLDTDLEYNSVLRRAFSEQELTKMRTQLTNILPTYVNDIKYLSFAQIIFLLSLYHIETMRSASGNFSFILNYFSNEGVTNSKIAVLVEAIAEEVFSNFLKISLTRRAGLTLDECTIQQLKEVLINCCHRVEKMSTMSIRCAKRFFDVFPQLIFNKKILYTVLELLQLLWQGCEGEFQDEYCPSFEFTSPVVHVTIQLPDSYEYRKVLLNRFTEATSGWLQIGKGIAPNDMDDHLQTYLYETAADETGTGIHFGRTTAMKYGLVLSQSRPQSETSIRTSSYGPDNASLFAGTALMKSYFGGRVSSLDSHLSSQGSLQYMKELRAKLKDVYGKVKNHEPVPLQSMKVVLSEAAAWLVRSKNYVEYDIIRYICWIPVYAFTIQSLKLAANVWSWLSIERGDLYIRLANEIKACWLWTISQKMGIFSNKLNISSPFVYKMEYTPTDPQAKVSKFKLVYNTLGPHAVWVQFFFSRFDAFKNTKPELIRILFNVLIATFRNTKSMSTNPLARESRFQLLLLGLKMLRKHTMDPVQEYVFRTELYNCAFAWFATAPRWSSSGNKQLCIDEHKMVVRFKQALDNDNEVLNMKNMLFSKSGYHSGSLSSLPGNLNEVTNSSFYKLNERPILDKTRDEVIELFKKSRKLLQLLTENEISRLNTINNPCPSLTETPQTDTTASIEKFMTEDSWRVSVRFAWSLNPGLALHLSSRFKSSYVDSELQTLITKNPLKVVGYSEALSPFLNHTKNNDLTSHKWLLYWAPVPPITGVSFLASSANNNAFILQYAMRVLHYFPVTDVFFYIPQIVQALRYDSLGYVEKFILDAARVSQLFAHQIIWNMKANFYRNVETQEQDPLKPVYEKVIDEIVNQLSGADKEFYEREFNFFNKVTGISGTLKPYIKKPKEEKKKKIDEEMLKINVDVGVYLPSNPDGVVVDIDYKSGRPLQSHAKAPFMATFKIKKEEEIIKEHPEGGKPSDSNDKLITYREVWQSAIFKVGDDCRQDVLALQLIAIFKNIYTNSNLDLYLFPYRTVATAPGCGVIDVIPNSISRDQLGREKVNDLNNYFLATYGGYNSIAYQKARNAYVQSVAAYSVVSYILQIKDRHNGNIMVDNQGHTIHIDFGFILEISPGGINFESSPFKLTTEMIQVMGGQTSAQSYRHFAELCVKAYLAVRPYAEEIIQVVQLMLDSGLPCFKGDGTIKNLRWRFQLDKSERAAADFMMSRINESFNNKRTVLYDSFQFATNGIPY